MGNDIATVAGDWQVAVPAGRHRLRGREVPVPHPRVFDVARPDRIRIIDERHEAIPLAGARPRALCAEEGCPLDRLDQSSFRVCAGPGGEGPFEPGLDYRLEPRWAFFGRVAGGGIADARTAYVSYEYETARLDSLVLRADGSLALLRGASHLSGPRAPALAPDDFRLANIWVPGLLRRLSGDCLLPVTEDAYPRAPGAGGAPAQRLLPRAWRALTDGGSLHVLAWGDSVTAAGWIPAERRWPQSLAASLAGRFPRATIRLSVAGWGGKTSADFLAAPPGSPFTYQDSVLNARPDLVVSEFVNDAKMDEAAVESQYGRFLADFARVGAEWIVCAPHYTNLQWMGFGSEKAVDEDTRPYVKALRGFAARHGVALADVSAHWGRLWRRGIPYTTWLSNGINHPDADGMRLYADALSDLFTGA